MFLHREIFLLLGLCFLVASESSFRNGLLSWLKTEPWYKQRRKSSPTLTVNPPADSVDKVAVFIQAFGVNNTYHNDVWDDILTCVSNVGKARNLVQNFDMFPWESIQQQKPFDFDVYISLPTGVRHIVLPSLIALGASNVFVTEVHQNVGMDIKQFIEELQQATQQSNSYEYFLKIHSKTSMGWRRQALESLCGSPAQVLSVLSIFRDDSDIGAVVPQGLTISKKADIDMLFRSLRAYYKSDANGLPGSFSPVNVANMKDLYFRMFNRHLDPDEDRYVCAAGTMFWAKKKEFKVQEWVELLPYLENKWTRGYVVDGGIEHAIERLFITIPRLHGVRIAEIVPAPKTLGLYYSEYYDAPESGALHGKNATKWSVLNASIVANLSTPLPVSEGGLGYYDLTDVSVRRRQGQLARQAGLHGFVYNHYWYSGVSYKYGNPFMGKVPELMMQDNEPNMPFMFSWANEPVSRDGVVGLCQNFLYGGKEEWERHFKYLLPFFQHHNYIRINNKPVFAIYRIGILRRELLAQMMFVWRTMAEAAGLQGLFILYTLNNFVHKDKVLKGINRQCDASYQYFPQFSQVFPHASNASSTFNIDSKNDQEQFWGGFVGSNRVRRQGKKNLVTRLVPPQEFEESIRFTFKAMGEYLPLTDKQVNIPNLFFLNAWNDWNEQAQLEPSSQHKFAYLSALKNNLENMPITLLK